MLRQAGVCRICRGFSLRILVNELQGRESVVSAAASDGHFVSAGLEPPLSGPYAWRTMAMARGVSPHGACESHSLNGSRIYHVDMSNPRIQLLVFDGCPLADAARDALEVALTMVGLPKYEEVDILDPDSADELRGWGSPTILVDGQDLLGNVKGESVGCRVYDSPGRVPSPEMIAAVIRSSME